MNDRPTTSGTSAFPQKKRSLIRQRVRQGSKARLSEEVLRRAVGHVRVKRVGEDNGLGWGAAARQPGSVAKIKADAGESIRISGDGSLRTAIAVPGSTVAVQFSKVRLATV